MLKAAIAAIILCISAVNVEWRVDGGPCDSSLGMSLAPGLFYTDGAVPAAVAIPEVVAWYEMNDNAESYDVADSSGNGRTASLNINTSEMAVSGLVGGALTCASGGSFFNPPAEIDTILEGPSSFSLWVKITEYTPFVCPFAGLNSPDHHSWCWFHLPTESVNVGMGGDNNTASNVPLVVGDWNNIICVNDGATMKVYVNSVLCITVPIIGYHPETWVFFYGWDSNYQPIDVDEIKFFSEALSSEQVKAVYEEYAYEPAFPPVTIYFDATAYYPGNAENVSLEYPQGDYAQGAPYGDLPSVSDTSETYIFTGWVDDYSSEVNVETIVPSNSTTIYATWMLNE